MPIRSMTGFAQVRGQVNAQLAFALSLKSVNHRFLDLHFRLPSDTDSLEMKLRRLLKEKLVRGHVEVTLSLDYSGANGVAFNRQLVGAYVQAFRSAADEFGVTGEPDLNVVLRMPGAMRPTSSSICSSSAPAARRVASADARRSRAARKSARDSYARARASAAAMPSFIPTWDSRSTFRRRSRG